MESKDIGRNSQSGLLHPTGGGRGCPGQGTQWGVGAHGQGGEVRETQEKEIHFANVWVLALYRLKRHCLSWCLLNHSYLKLKMKTIY